MTDYDSIRYVYATAIHSHGSAPLHSSAALAILRAAVNHERFGIEADGYAYRVIDNTYASCVDPDGDVWGSRTQLEIVAFPVIKRTKDGFRIWRGHNGRSDETRWVSHRWNKTWAALTPEEAVRDYAARRKRQASIYEARAAKARHLVEEATHLLDGGPL